jgi:hypothetical protein
MKDNKINPLPVNQYQEVWESRASIRTRPRKFIDFKEKGVFFPENKQPLLFNQDVIDLGPEVKETILLQSFYKYLNDIVTLEIDLIVNTCNKILNSDLPIEYSKELKLNARTIIIDEYYHVYIAHDMMLQLKHQFPDLKDFNYSISDSINAVNQVKSKLDKKYHDVFEIIAVCIFETTLVKELVEFFYTDNIHPSIKHYINDHMNDEAKHYGFFYNLLCYTWENIPIDYQENIGQYFSEFIINYLNINSEKEFNLSLLISILKEENKAKEIISNLYTGFIITPEVPIVKNVLNVLRKSKLLESLSVVSSFKNIGWDL